MTAVLLHHLKDSYDNSSNNGSSYAKNTSSGCRAERMKQPAHSVESGYLCRVRLKIGKGKEAAAMAG
jgi:hypothetical protein